MDTLTLGVVATSAKEHERRLPIHPRHLSRVEPDLRQRTFLERGYGRSHGMVFLTVPDRKSTRLNSSH